MTTSSISSPADAPNLIPNMSQHLPEINRRRMCSWLELNPFRTDVLLMGNGNISKSSQDLALTIRASATHLLRRYKSPLVLVDYT